MLHSLMHLPLTLSSLDDIKADFMPLYVSLMADEHDSVRLLAVEAALALAKKLSKDDVNTQILPSVINSVKVTRRALFSRAHAVRQDRSWRVRGVFADKFVAFQTAFGNDVTKLELVPMLVRLLQDPEAEVKISAINRLPEIGTSLSGADRQILVLTNVVPHLSELVPDTSALSLLVAFLTAAGPSTCASPLRPS